MGKKKKKKKPVKGTPRNRKNAENAEETWGGACVCRCLSLQKKLHESGNESGSNEVFFLKCLLQRSIGLYAWKAFKGLLKEFIQSAKIVHQVT